MDYSFPKKKKNETRTAPRDEENIDDEEDEERSDSEEEGKNDKNKNGRRYQIGYILVKQRFRNGVKCCESYPGADIASDHKLVAKRKFVKLKKLRKARRRPKWDIERLKKNCISFQKSVEDTIKPIQEGVSMKDGQNLKVPS